MSRIVKSERDIWPYLHSLPDWPDQFYVEVPLLNNFGEYYPKASASLVRLYDVAWKRGYSTSIVTDYYNRVVRTEYISKKLSDKRKGIVR